MRAPALIDLDRFSIGTIGARSRFFMFYPSIVLLARLFRLFLYALGDLLVSPICSPLDYALAVLLDSEAFGEKASPLLRNSEVDICSLPIL